MPKKSKAKQRVVEYRMSIHYALCHGPVERLSAIVINEKDAWVGVADSQTVLTINQPELFGGIKKEGGAVGRVLWQSGTETQLLDAHTAAKHGKTPATMPGYRGIATAYFTEQPGATPAGFYWSANQPYVPPAAFRITRIDRGWRPDIAGIAGDTVENAAIMISLDVSGSMDWGAVNDVNAYPSRLSVAKDAINQLLTTLENATGANTLDIHIVGWSASVAYQITRRNCGPADYTALRAYVATFSSQSGTDFNRSVETAATFFNGAGAKKRFFLFLTDGEPTTAGSADSAAATLAPLTASQHAFNLFLANTAETAKLDNTPADAVPVMDALNRDRVAGAMLAALSDRLDSNPAHMLRECFTNVDWGRGLPASVLDGDSFTAAAEKLFDERFGLTMVWTQQAPLTEFMQEILDHIQAVLYISPVTGKWTLKLIRDDYDLSSTLILDPSNSKINRFQRRNEAEILNELILTWTNPDSEKEETLVVQDLGSIVASNGEITSDNRNYYGVRRASLARDLAERDLASMTAPLATAEIEVNRVAWAVVPGDVVRLTWPEYNVQELPMRVFNVNYGEPGDSKITLSLTEDIFATVRPQVQLPPTTESPDLGSAPTAPDYIVTQTLGYWFSRVAGELPPEGTAYTLFLLGFNELDTQGVRLQGETADAAGNIGWTDLEELAVSARSTLLAPLAREAESTLPALGPYTAGQGPTLGGFALLGNGGEKETEIVLLSARAGNDWIVKRGMFDTVPQAWPTGTPIFFFTTTQAFIDPEERGELVPVDYRLYPFTSLGSTPAATEITFTPIERVRAPLRPGNVTVQGAAWADIDARMLTSLDFTWANRNAETEGDQPLSWTAGTVALPAGVQTVFRVLSEAGAELARSDAGTGTSASLADSVWTRGEYVVIETAATTGTVDSIQGHRVRVRTLSAPANVILATDSLGEGVYPAISAAGVPDGSELLSGDAGPGKIALTGV